MSDSTNPSAAEVAARRTAAAAVLADFRADLRAAPLTSPPPMTIWALRLASVLGDVLAAQVTDPTNTADRQPPQPSAASHVRADRSAYLTPDDTMTVIGALTDGVRWQASRMARCPACRAGLVCGQHDDCDRLIASLRAVSGRLGDDRP
jgi:hypothetical protein